MDKACPTLHAEPIGVRPDSSWRIDDTVLVGGPLPTSFAQDFADGFGEWTQAAGSWSAANAAAENTALAAGWQYLLRDQAHGDGVFRCTYTLDSDSTASVPYALMEVRGATNYSDLLRLAFYEDEAKLIERANSANTVLATDTGADSTLDQAYDVTVRLDGDRIEVWRGEEGAAASLLFAEDGLAVTGGERIRLVAGPYTYAVFDDAALDVPDPAVTAYAYDTANELTAVTEDGLETYYSYDAWGRTASKWRGDGTSVHAEYTWFAGDKLKRIDSTFPGEEALVSFNYESLGVPLGSGAPGDAGHSLCECPGKRRNKYVNTTDLTWYRWAGWNVIADYTGDGSWTVGARTMSYTPGLAQAPGANPTTAAYQYSMADHLGSVRQITAQDKSVLAHYAYTPYGETDFAVGLAMTHGFTGHRWDAETGMYFAPFRYYAPQNARWMKRDPAGFVDGTNVYAYARCTPLVYRDALGLHVPTPCFTMDEPGYYEQWSRDWHQIQVEAAPDVVLLVVPWGRILGMFFRSRVGLWLLRTKAADWLFKPGSWLNRGPWLRLGFGRHKGKQFRWAGDVVKFLKNGEGHHDICRVGPWR